MRVLPADVYDTLEFSALAFEGIGSWNVYARPAPSLPADPNYTCCIIGHAIVAADDDSQDNPIVRTLDTAQIDVIKNDKAVNEINQRKGVSDLDARITFQEWCKELNVVRGE